MFIYMYIYIYIYLSISTCLHIYLYKYKYIENLPSKRFDEGEAEGHGQAIVPCRMITAA